MSYRAEASKFAARERHEIISVAVTVFNRLKKFGRVIVFVSGGFAEIFEFHKFSF
jgi:phosphoserine phosphatase